ncbi:hypothetical protein CWI42_020030 [Ordospora colligata]|nr:hypothetical protein CWI42_020030 [Ordospora colligata]
MNICRNKEFVNVIDNGFLLVMDIITLTIIHRKEYGAGTVIACSEEHVFVGTGTGILIMIDLLSMNEAIVFKSSTPITAVFYLDGSLYCGNEDGVIQIYGLTEESDVNNSSVPLSSMRSEIDEMNSVHTVQRIRLIKEIKHSAPVRMICSDGVEFFVADMRNKITMYPSNKVYDIVRPSLVYKNYVFASERNMLYCKTRNAFSTYLVVDGKICEYVFSENGGVLFVRCGEEVSVFDFNSKDVVKRMRFSGMFVYDDDRNRILRYEAGVMVSVDDVLDRKYESMNDVVFRSDEIVEKKVRVDGIEEDAERVYYVYEKGKKSKRKREWIDSVEYTDHKSVSLYCDATVEERKELNMMRMNVGSNEVYESSSVNGCGSVQEGCIQGINTNEGLLLCYNTQGYMICVRNGNIHRIEVSYHDITRRKIEIDNNSGYTHGGFCGDSVAIGNGSMVFYIGPDMKWEKKIASRAICVSDSMIVALEDEIRIFDYTGNEIFNCLIPNVHMICCHGTTIAVFGDDLIIIELFERTSRHMLPCAVSFACFDEFGRLFYVMNKKMYCLYKGLAVKMCDISMDVLIVFKKKMVLLSRSKRLFPSPHVEYAEVNVPWYIEHDERISMQKMKTNEIYNNEVNKNMIINTSEVYNKETDMQMINITEINNKETNMQIIKTTEVNNKENTEHNSQHIDAKICQNGNLLNVNIKQDINQASKRYNPFK